jgi:hypothetical protein
VSLKSSSEKRDGADIKYRNKGVNIFKVSSGNGTPFLHFKESIFNDVALFVDIFIVRAVRFSVDLQRNGRNNAARRKGKNDVVGIIECVVKKG